MDACYLRGHRYALKPIKNHTRDQNSLLFHSQEAQTMLFYCSTRAEISERQGRDHNKSRHNKSCSNYGPCSSRPHGSTAAIEVNTTKTPAWTDCGRNQPARWEDMDMSQTNYYNCSKKGYFDN